MCTFDYVDCISNKLEVKKKTAFDDLCTQKNKMRSSMCSTHFVTTNDNFSEFVFFVHLLNETIFIQKINMIDEIERWKMVILISTENSNVFNGNLVYLNSDILQRVKKSSKNTIDLICSMFIPNK